jgi:hypothetical protein
MSKQISNTELSNIVATLLVGKASGDYLDTPDKYAAFMTDIAKVICDHCGGQVMRVADNAFGPWLVGISGDESAPEDGGIWKNYDPEGELFE